MFERFTEGARQAVVDAQREARELGHSRIGTEHLLLAVLSEGSPVRTTLEPLGLSYEQVREQVVVLTGGDPAASAEALRDLGIDVDEVRRRVEASFGPGALDEPPPGRSRLPFRRRRGSGHIPFTPEAKKSLELALREALRLSSHEITVAHVVLGLMRADGLGTRAVTALGASPADVRRAVLDQIGRAA
jgi:ATP-dependent Clp protease ATP-binding subunit ClpA